MQNFSALIDQSLVTGLEVDPKILLFLLLAAFAAGWIDAIVGGGGLIQLPVLLLVPGITPVQALATNKLASIFGTAVSSATYYSKLKPKLRIAIPMALVALIGAFLGASLAVSLPPTIFLPIILAALVSVALFTIFRPQLGVTSNPRADGILKVFLACAIGLVIGFYDGMLGPGTGSFLVISLVSIIGFNFLQASAYAKIANLATNAGALLLFMPHGVVLWQLGLCMAVSNMAGSFLGSRTAIARGSKFVRIIFLTVVTALIIKLGYDFISTLL